MRILHCLRAPVGGLFRHVLDLAAEQANIGHDVGILADANTGDSLTDAKFEAVQPRMSLGIKRIAMGRQPGVSDIGAGLAVQRHATALAIDIVHGHGAKGGAYARLAAFAMHRFGTPVRCFYTPHGGSLHYDPATLAGKIFLGMERMLQPLGDGLIFESRYAARQYAEKIGLGNVLTRVIPNGLRPAEFEFLTPAANAADIIYVGEMRELKGVDVLLDALAIVKKTRRVSAVLVGAGPDAAKFRAQADTLGLSGDVTFPGAMLARDAFKLGRCLVLPSRAESLPYVVLEAAAAGLALIATNVGGIPQIVEGTTNALVPPGDAVALAGAISEAIAFPDVAAARADSLRAAVAERFTVTAMTRDVLNFYTEPQTVNHARRSMAELQHR